MSHGARNGETKICGGCGKTRTVVDCCALDTIFTCPEESRYPSGLGGQRGSTSIKSVVPNCDVDDAL